jgi:hypothetical protein
LKRAGVILTLLKGLEMGLGICVKPLVVLMYRYSRVLVYDLKIAHNAAESVWDYASLRKTIPAKRGFQPDCALCFVLLAG